MRLNNPEYKAPVPALLWSMTFPGFGQIYNKQYILGSLFIILEFIINNFACLNFAIMESFHGEFQKAHDLLNYQWGIYYPSIWCFSMWQAYNRALTINSYLEGKIYRECKLIGALFGVTFGMNMGIYIHFQFKQSILRFLESPVFSGLILGILCGIIGHQVETAIKTKVKS